MMRYTPTKKLSTKACAFSLMVLPDEPLDEMVPSNHGDGDQGMGMGDGDGNEWMGMGE